VKEALIPINPARGFYHCTTVGKRNISHAAVWGRMKKILVGVTLLFAFAVPLFAQKKEQGRLENSGLVMKEILAAQHSIPKSILDGASCVVVLPSVLKFSFGIGSSYGRGVMTCRGGDSFTGPWGPPTMMALFGGSAGLQFGGEATDFVLLLMSPRSASSILTSKVKLGGDATAAAGPFGRTASAETDITMRAEILSYSRARGIFAGISLSGSTLRADNGANRNLYGKDLTAKSIVFENAVASPSSAKLLLDTLEKATPKKSGRD
jgi:lipid-binding SYLF domain-containing protein